MARERVWQSTLNAVGASTDEIVPLYTGLGTVERIIGEVWGGAETAPAGAAKFWRWVINRGAAAASATPAGLDDESVILRGLAVAPQRSSLAVYSEPAPVMVNSDTGRIMQPGDTLWLRMTTASGGVTWFWTWSIRVLILLPETP